MPRSRWKILAVLLLAILSAPWIAWNGFVQQMNAAAYDILLRLQPVSDSAARQQIVLLAIDDETASRYGPLPLRRDLLAAGLERMATAKPRVVVVDLLLSERSDPEADRRLSAALGKLPAVVLSAALAPGTHGKQPAWISPIAEFQAQARAVGHAHVEPDPDGVIRVVLLAKATEERRHWALALEAYRLLAASDDPLVEEAERLRVAGLAIPASAAAGRAMWIHYAGAEGSFRRISFARLLEETIDTRQFGGKVVILGVSAQGGGDRLFTPVSAGVGMSGIEIHANMLRTVLDRAFLRALTTPQELALLLATAALLFATAWWRRGRNLGYLMAGGFLLLPACAYLALRWGTILPLASWISTYLAVSLLASVVIVRLFRQQLGEALAGRREYAFRLQAIAHEIRTPLTAIQASSELLAEGDLPQPKKAEVARVIHKESKRLAGVVTTFLDVERISAGMLKLRRQPVELSALLAQVVERAGLLAVRKNMRIDADLSAAEISADAELLEYAFYNLLSNAVKYSPNNTSVLVRLRAGAAGAEISVTDQGYGIAPSERERVFDRFYRVQRDSGEQPPGTGVGLALVKEIVTLHNGTIEVDSITGRGSCFTVRLPGQAPDE